MAGSSDTVPAKLAGGEFVIKRGSAEMIPKPFLEFLNGLSDNAAHDSIDAVIAQATLSQMQPMVNGGMVGNENIAGYENGGDVPKDQVLPDWSKIRPQQLLKLFKEKNQGIFPTELESSILDRSYDVQDSLEEAGLDDLGSTSDKWWDEYSKAMGGMGEWDYDDARWFLQDMAAKRPREMTDAERAETDLVLSALTPAIARLYSENPDIFKSPPEGTTRKKGDWEAQYYDKQLPLTHNYKRRLKSTFRNALPGFYPEMSGYQNGGKVPGYENGGSVSDATATSAMDELLAQAMLAESAQGQSQYSMVDADRVGAEENEMMNMIMSMAIPGAGVAGTTRGVLKQLGKRALKDVSKKEVVKTPVKHLSKIAGLKPFKQKEKVLDKIASTMKVAPGRKIEQTSKDWLLSPASKKLDMDKIKGYRVLENTLNKPFDKMDLINPGYLQRYINKLVKIKKPSQLKKITSGIKTSDVKRHDVVDALYKKGFLNVNDLKRLSLSYKKKGRREAIENLLKEEPSSLFPGAVRGYKTGGKVPKGSHASGKWGEFGEYNKALGQPDSAGVAEQAGIIQALLDELIAEESYKDSVQNEMDKNYLLDSLINEAPLINEMLKTLPDSPGLIESPQRPTKNQFLEELLKQGVII